MAQLDHTDFSDLPDPVLDLKMSNLNSNDDDFNDDYPKIHNKASKKIISGGGNDYENSDDDDDDDVDDDLPYDPNDVEIVLEDLQHLCDKEGVNYTVPMENQVKRMLKEEPVCYSHLMWYIRGMILANQTQILPNITGAISDMKMETKQMQQAANRLNKETSSIEKTAKSISKELSSIKDEIQESFRRSMKLFMEQMEVQKPVLSETISKTLKPANLLSSLNEVKGQVNDDDKKTVITSDSPADIPGPSFKNNASAAFLDEKVKALKSYGIDIQVIKTLTPATIDAMYPDSVHAQLKTVKMTSTNKAKIRENIEARLEEYLDSYVEEEEEDSSDTDQE